jgi:hypothetical protein
MTVFFKFSIKFLRDKLTRCTVTRGGYFATGGQFRSGGGACRFWSTGANEIDLFFSVVKRSVTCDTNIKEAPIPVASYITTSQACLPSTQCPMSQQQPAETSWNANKSRSLLFLIALVFIFLQAGLFAGNLSASNNVSTDPSTTVQLRSTRLTGSVADHPIPQLMDDAERRFRAVLSRQSRSLRASVKEYRRRYGRNPPKGFDEWWRFAQANKVKMVDEYDSLISDLEPFWGMTGEEFRQRAFQVCTLCYSFIFILTRPLTRHNYRQPGTFLQSIW